jgi:ATP adenylyltransferase
MDHLWSPWRYRYVSQSIPDEACLFCRIASAATPEDDHANRVVLRAERNFVLLNLYPYTSGHLMIAPYAHVATLQESEPETLEEMIRLAQRAESALRAVYHPGGVNVGINVGKAAGAGVEQHIHMHVLPRWLGDVNFMTAVGETRVLPEDLDTTLEKLRKALSAVNERE